MDSILHQELINLESSINYWLVIAWIIAIFASLIAIPLVIRSNKNFKKESIIKEESINSNKGKGF